MPRDALVEARVCGVRVIYSFMVRPNLVFLADM